MDALSSAYARGEHIAQIMYDCGSEPHEIEAEATEYDGDTAQAIRDYARRMIDDGR